MSLHIVDMLKPTNLCNMAYSIVMNVCGCWVNGRFIYILQTNLLVSPQIGEIQYSESWNYLKSMSWFLWIAWLKITQSQQLLQLTLPIHDDEYKDDAATLYKTYHNTFPKAPILSYFYPIHAYPSFDLRYSSKSTAPLPWRKVTVIYCSICNKLGNSYTVHFR